MKLRKIELSGFKSFVERTVVNFDEQVTAVVGPNGCGKSNIIDAIRWAMGEQSARSLRGKTMDEVIFAGSESRGPSSVAEVTLTFDNSSGQCHHEYAGFSEIAITRRLNRDGSSEYMINGTTCRLRDVTELLLSAGVSPRSSMVEQGRMGMIVTARPEERRLLIEEAAGIAKYRIHRRATQRKIESTKQNLLRVSDVVSEMKRTLNSLKRQVSKAKRYRELREELTELELRVASHRYLELTAHSRTRGAMLERVEAELEVCEKSLQELEVEIGKRREAQRVAEDRLEKLQAKSYQCANEVQQTRTSVERLEAQLKAEIRAEVEAGLRSTGLSGRLEETGRELEQTRASKRSIEESVKQLEAELGARQEKLNVLRGGRVDLERSLEEHRRQVTRSSAAVASGERALESFEQRHREGLERIETIRFEQGEAERKTVELEAQVKSLDERLGTLRQLALDLGASREEQEAEKRKIQERLRQAEGGMEQAGRELTRCRSRLQSLEEIAGRYENVGQGVRELMRKPEVREKTQAIVAEVLDVPSRLEPALAAVLGDRLQDLVVEDLSSAAEIAEMIASRGKGRAAAIPMVPRRIGLPAEAPEGKGIIGLLADQVGCERRYEPLVRQLFWGVVVVEDLPTALEKWNEQGGELTYVTLRGEVLSPSGRISAGQEEVGLALLQTKREIRRLREQAEVLQQAYEAKSADVETLRRAMTEVSATIESLRQDAHKGDLEVVQQQKDLNRAQEELKRYQREVTRLQGESQRISSVIEGCLRDRDRVSQEISTAKERRKEAERALESEQEVLAKSRGDEESAVGTLTEVKVTAASARERLDSHSKNETRLANECRDLERRIKRTQEERTRAAGAQGRVAGEIFLARERFGALTEAAEKALHDLNVSKNELDLLRQTLSKEEVETQGARKLRDDTRATAEKLRLDHHECRMELKSLIERVEEARAQDLEAVIVDYHLKPPVTEEETARIEELRRAIDRIGPVSLTAVEEYDELKVRYDESTSQQEDLEQSLGHLQRAIQKLNREGRKRFRECFDEVNGHFQQIFPRLFEGGRAKLMLTDEEDLLETGVEIVAQPPGKKLGRMELMSGGEKAMTAVSLIFALFKASPSPFTVLDEVDAPFDDANVRRFLEELREMAVDSQFVMVTHSKLSMSEADVLYGVTMEEPGISKLVSVRLSEHEDLEEAAAA